MLWDAKSVDDNFVVSVFFLVTTVLVTTNNLTFSKITYTTDSASSVKLSLRRTRGAIIWPADVAISSVMSAEQIGDQFTMVITMKMESWSPIVQNPEEIVPIMTMLLETTTTVTIMMRDAVARTVSKIAARLVGSASAVTTARLSKPASVSLSNSSLVLGFLSCGSLSFQTANC